jgi:hypothetical protein
VHDVSEFDVAFIDDDPDFFPGFADDRGLDGLAGFEVAGRGSARVP